MPPNVRDELKVNRAKVLMAIWNNKSRVARELGVSDRTVSRYLSIPDDDEKSQALAEVRLQEEKRYVEDAWKIIHRCNERVKEKVGQAGFKDSAIVQGIYFDKVRALEARGTTERTEKLIVWEIHSSENRGKAITNTDQISGEQEPIQGIDSGSGVRKDLPLMLGSGEDSDREPEIIGNDSSEYLSGVA